jgi:hypothetical protein
MPKSLFYAGVVCCVLLALSSGLEVARRAGLESVLMERTLQGAVETSTPYLLLAILLMSVPVAAILLRMASLVAARSLFAAVFATFSIACTGLSIAYLTTLELRIILLLRELGSLSAAAAERSLIAKSLFEAQHAGFYAFGWFISVMLLSLRPYFRIQASRTLSALVWLPAPLFAWSLLADLSAGWGDRLLPVPSLVFWTLLTAIFFAIAGHCIRHRHLFIEVTNLRELLDTRAIHRDSARRGLTIKGVAFDS